MAVVAAYDAPTIANDLAVFRAEFGLPACGAGCFTKVDQQGGTAYPPADAGWAQEISLDVEMVSAACPLCHIVLVEGNSARISDLAAAENTAASFGPLAISNSYGASEFSGESAYDSASYNHPGVAITASAGDSGFGTSYPSTSPNVIAVGGTSLRTLAGVWSESAWSGSGSGCSQYEAKPTWQQDAGCTNRTVADVSAVADPQTGVAFYDSTPNGSASGWQVGGGTSVAAPFIAGAYSLGSSSLPPYPSTSLYSGSVALNDVITGSNGVCLPLYLCTAGPGYDGPTGRGTPFGSLGAARPSSTTGGAEVPIAPTRFLDTRSSAPVAGGSAVSFQAAGVNGVPANAAAVVMNLTVTDPQSAGFLTAYPSQSAKPATSNVNFGPNQTVPNLAVVPVGPDGKIVVANSASGSAQVIVDVLAYITGGTAAAPGAFSTYGPSRIFDTRTSSGAVPPNGSVSFQIGGVGGIPPNVAAVVLNVTATQPSSFGFLTVFASGSTKPNSSNVNYAAGQTVPNLAVVPVGPDGKVTIANQSSGTVQVIADVEGYFVSGTPSATGMFGGITPTRFLDTRSSLGPVPAGGTVSFQAAGVNGVPSNATGIWANLTVTQPTSFGFLTGYASGTQPPSTSNVNYATAQTVPNMAYFPIGADGKVTIGNTETGAGTSVQIIADVSGYTLG